MAEYIEREALLSDIQAAVDNGGMGSMVAGALKRYVKRVPAADVAPVVHGRWEKDGTCSNCKGLNPTYRANKWSAEYPDFLGNYDHLNYCPNCGAKMDLKGE